MKRLKVLALGLAALVAGGCLAGCGRSESELIKDPNTLRIFAWSGGYGSEWLYSLEEGFEALYDDINVDITTSPLREKVQLEWEVASTNNRYDIIMVDGDNATVAYTKYKVPGLEYAFAQVDDVFGMKPAGEEDGDLTVGDKMIDGVPEYFTQFEVNNNQTFSFPTVATASGWIYNEEVLEDCGLTVPRTTDEFIEACKVIKSKGYTPIIFGGSTDYYTSRLVDLWVQYNGYDDYVHYMAGEAYDEMMGDYRYSVNIFDQRGREYALEVLEELFGYKNGEKDPECYIDVNSTGYKFMDAQQKFMSKDENGKYKYAFMSNGGWIENEMREFYAVGSVPLNMMQTPLLSDIVYMDKTKDREDQEPVMSEKTLRDCVSYFRGEGEKPAVDDTILETLEAAYNRVSAGSPHYAAVIPSTSKKIDLAKKFLSYLYSDDAIERVAESNCGAMVCADYDYTKMDSYSSLTTLQKQVLDFMSGDYQKNIGIRSHPVVYKGGLSIVRDNLFTVFASKNPNDRKTAHKVFTDCSDYYKSGSTWQDLLRSAGVL